MINRTTVISRLPAITLLLAAVGLLMVAVSGPGYRFELWRLSIAFGLLRIGGYLAIVATAAGIAMAIFLYRNPARFPMPQSMAMVSLAVVIGAFGAAYPLAMIWQSKQVPPIHDITTDVTNPPGFVSIAKVRVTAGATNPVAYGGPAVAAQQVAAYPDIKPLRMTATRESAFQRALTAARRMGWRIISESPEDGLIEASDKTPFFGFVDDVAIRVMADGAGSRIDIRSLSRIGKGDVGVNARRVRRYLQKLTEAD